MTKERNICRVEAHLTYQDLEKLVALSKERKQSRSAIAREAIRFYISNHEKLRKNNSDSELSQTIKSMTDRICGMLARQGTQTGTLFELAWQNHVENNMQDRFVAATNLVKSKLRKRLEQDEQDISKRMKGVLEK